MILLELIEVGVVGVMVVELTKAPLTVLWLSFLLARCVVRFA